MINVLIRIVYEKVQIYLYVAVLFVDFDSL